MSTLKKATAFTKKLRQINEGNKDAIIKELSQVKLENYKSEVVTGLGDNLMRQTSTSDIDSCVEVYLASKSKLQGDFHLKVAELFKKILMTAEVKEKDCKVKNVLFFTVKLHFSQFFVYKVADDVDMFDSIMSGGNGPLISKKALKFDSLKFSKEVYKYVTEKDEHFLNCAIVVEFVDHFSYCHSEFNDITSLYYKRLRIFMSKLNQAIVKAEKYGRDFLFNRGHEISDENKRRNLAMSNKFENLLPMLQFFCDLYKDQIPKFTKIENELIRPGSIVFAQNTDAIHASSEIWDEVDNDPDFYKIIQDLRLAVPRLFEQSSTNENDQSDDELSTEVLIEDDNEDTIETPTMVESNTHAPLAVMLENVVDITNQDRCDKYAIKFCEFNSKLSRKKLTAAMMSAARRRLELVPYFCRVIKTLGKYFPDIIQCLKNVIESNFKYFMANRKESTNLSYLLQPRYAIVCFISECIKFQLLDPPLYIYYFQSLIEGFHYKPNVYACCKLLESGGRFFYALTKLQGNEALKLKYENVLEVLVKRKSQLDAHDNRYSTEIDNAVANIYANNAATKIDVWETMPVYAFISEYLSILCSKNQLAFLSTVRKLNWSTDEPWLLKLLSNPSLVVFSSIPCLAWLLAKLLDFYPLFVLKVIDRISEIIKFDFKLNLYQHNQRRVVYMKYVGELFNFKLVPIEYILDVLQFTLSFGWENGFPYPNQVNPYDAFHDYFRIRLFGTLLTTSGALLQKVARDNMKIVIGMFYVYYTAKQIRCKLPLDVKHFIKDAFNVIVS
eukprot:NODE_797_length_4175_cov_0.242826.p1 type:complete len:783 gc:universal NODE_797_length_4175_cov_0.242826:724-3072(+)